MIDLTAYDVQTPSGVGKYVSYENGMVTVLMDWDTLVEFDGSKCYPIGRGDT